MKEKKIQELEKSVGESKAAWQLPERRVPQQAPPAIGIGMPHHEFSEELADEVGMRPPWRTHAFRDPRVSVRRDMAQLRHDPFLRPDTRIRGFVVDIETFALEEVFVDAGAAPVVRTPAVGVPEIRSAAAGG